MYKKSLLSVLALAIVGGAIFSNEKKSDKKCKKCKDAKNFKSQLGETVEENKTWKQVNKYFNENEVVLKINGSIVNQATNQASYAVGADALTALATASGNRILVCQPDGTVTFDSATKAAGGNTYANAKDKKINENHNTRPAIMSAQLTCDGRGNELKISTSTGSIEAYDARVIVNEYGNNQGSIRVSRAQVVV